jgi:hypothetical protein
VELEKAWGEWERGLQCVRRERRESRGSDRVPGFEAGGVFAVPGAQLSCGLASAGWSTCSERLLLL